MNKINSLIIVVFSILAVNCQFINNNTSEDYLFTSLNSEYTGVDFVNSLDYVEEFNIYRYRNFYNGGGVGLGDINNDGLIDIYFNSNMHANKLYLNLGNLKFKDITETAEVGGTRAWSTGVSFADVNGDGWLDIYVCNSGDIAGDNKQNELFINNGPLPDGQPSLSFTEMAENYNVADQGFSTHAAFFDYDKDGDLDIYLLNNSYQAIGSFDLTENLRLSRDPVGGDKLMRNDGEVFTDVTEEAGIYSSVIGFGLGVTVGDINMDSWLDIYVSNDFFERDYIYMNNRDGTFTESLTNMMRSTSAASMGADMGDINNDGYPEIFVTDMIPESDARLKTKTTFDSWENYAKNERNGYAHQFTRNMFHLNNTDNTFSEIGRLAGVYATDWSWGALIFDMDNDGFKDLFVANGIYQDLTDQDYIQHFSDMRMVRSIITGNNVDYKKLIDAIPSVKIPNYAFQNKGSLKFENKAVEWGLGSPSHSNGSAYGDLDNDGDHDLVVNNANMTAFVFRNETVQKIPEHHFIKFVLHGKEPNTFAIGSRINVIANGTTRYIEQVPVRGFQSTVDHNPIIGLGDIEVIDSIIVEWPTGRVTILQNKPTNQTLELYEKDAIEKDFSNGEGLSATHMFTEQPENANIVYKHIENEFNDFNRDKLLHQMFSIDGPHFAIGDINGDGLEDVHIGGAKNEPGALFVQQKSGFFKSIGKEIFEMDKLSEDTDAEFFDADGDGDLDLYVASGGNEFSSSTSALSDRLYLNNGSNGFSKSNQILPAGKFESSSCVRAGDFDNDGVDELFVGIRLKPFYYGVPSNGYILKNDGQGQFKDVTKELAPELLNIGMITDMQWVDVDGDKDLDIFIVGEWMPLTVFINESGSFSNKTSEFGLGKSSGWWNTVEAKDLDGDGDIDFIAGNHGWNSRFKASESKPVTMYVNDFDLNGNIEQVICYFDGDTSYPMALKHDLDNQIPFLKKKYPKYVDYMGQTIQDIFTPAQLSRAIKLEVEELASSVIWNEGNGIFKVVPLPLQAQLSSIYGIYVDDLNSDNYPDIITGGNFYKVKPELGRYDASYGEIFYGNKDGSFKYMPPKETGLLLKEQVRDINTITIGEDKFLIVARNNETVQVFKYRDD